MNTRNKKPQLQWSMSQVNTVHGSELASLPARTKTAWPTTTPRDLRDAAAGQRTRMRLYELSEEEMLGPCSGANNIGNMTPSRAMTFVKTINGTLKLSKRATLAKLDKLFKKSHTCHIVTALPVLSSRGRHRSGRRRRPHYAAQRAEAAGAPQNHGAPLDKVKLPAIGKFASPGWFTKYI
mmetsp:Transcript_36730/g.86277  ORF Transcript_36730/g.86277 Transcript_36730/m.86277 type:complete len:180 (+) Transcript_36730:217-756(+)